MTSTSAKGLSDSLPKAYINSFERKAPEGSLLDRLNAKKGMPGITNAPSATNITIEGNK